MCNFLGIAQMFWRGSYSLQLCMKEDFLMDIFLKGFS